jgi:hypothetical protein
MKYIKIIKVEIEQLRNTNKNIRIIIIKEIKLRNKHKIKIRKN